MAGHDDILTRLETLEARVALLEGKRLPSPRVEIAAAAEATDVPETSSHLALLGRSILIFGGAYLLRALTETGTIPQLAGLAAGLLYAGLWIFLADRAARASRRTEALYDCTTGAVIAFPLIWETATRFGLISPRFAAFLLILTGAAVLWVALRNGTSRLAWVATLSASASFIAVAVATQSALPLLAGATLFAAGVHHVAKRRRWTHVAWPAVAASDLLALGLFAAALFQRGIHGPELVALTLVVFALFWTGAIVASALVLRFDAGLIEIAHVSEATLVGAGGAAALLLMFDVPRGGVGLLALAGGAAMLAMIALVQRRGMPRLAATVSGAGGFVLLVGMALLAGGTRAAVIWVGFALIAAETARRTRSPLAMVHAALWSAGAALFSGLAGAALAQLVMRAPPDSVPIPALVVTAVALAAALRLAPAAEGFAGESAQTVLVGIGVAGIFAATVAAVGTGGGPIRLSLVRTAVLAALAALLPLAARAVGALPCARLARTALVAGGLKLVAEDLRIGTASSLVAAFSIYGAAMLAVARVKLAVTSGSKPAA